MALFSFFQTCQDKSIGLLHHVCDSHEWLGGSYDQEDQQNDDNLPWFDRGDKDFAEPQNIVLNPELLDSFKCYVRFRYHSLFISEELQEHSGTTNNY